MKSRASLWFGGIVALYAALFVLYAETAAFTPDEGYHLLAAQLIAAGRTPYLDFCFPQTPLNAYWNALWLRLLAHSWRVPHLLAALSTVAAVWLTGDYVLRHFPIVTWRLPAALATALLTGLNGVVFPYGPLQAYGICLLGLVAAFRFTLRAVEHGRAIHFAAAGFFAGIAAASSLLTAAAVPVFAIWNAYHQPAGARWRTLCAFTAGFAAPFLPVFYLVARAPRQTWFNLVRYHAFYRKLYWPETTQHDFEVLSAWLLDSQALILGVLALAGLLYVFRRTNWPASVKAQHALCAWLAAALSLEVGRAHPTFPRYFLLTVPFLAILAAAGLYALVSALRLERSLWPVTLLSLLMLAGLARTLYDRSQTIDTWSSLEAVAAKVDQVTRPGAPVLTVEPIYFLTRRTPPPGYELSYSHLVTLPPAEATLLHLLNAAQVKRQVQSGAFATVSSTDSDEVDDWDLRTLYRQSAEVGDYYLFWDWKGR
ncbi:MAG: hypothetical protein ABI759_30975 [Candidatus Solibacter sp.]